jgi:protein-disulfide isomerase
MREETSMNRLRGVLDGSASILMIVASGMLIVTTWTNRQTATPTAGGGGAPTPSVNVDARGLEIRLPERAGVDYRDGHLALIEFSDFQCPFSRQYAQDTLDMVKRTFVDSGALDYMFVHFPIESIHPLALKAGEAAECAAEQGKFWEMHRVLFENQSRLAESQFSRYALSLGLDTRKFDACLRTGMAPRIRQGVAEAQRIGIGATPSFAIGRLQRGGTVKILRIIRGAAAFATLETELKSLLPKA